MKRTSAQNAPREIIAHEYEIMEECTQVLKVQNGDVSNNVQEEDIHLKNEELEVRRAEPKRWNIRLRSLSTSQIGKL